MIGTENGGRSRDVLRQRGLAYPMPLLLIHEEKLQYFSQCRTSERGRLLFSGLSAG
jgi:hypothetical protein